MVISLRSISTCMHDRGQALGRAVVQVAGQFFAHLFLGGQQALVLGLQRGVELGVVERDGGLAGQRGEQRQVARRVVLAVSLLSTSRRR